MRDPYEHLRRIQEAATKIEQYTKQGRENFEREERIRLAIIYYLQLAGQAIRALPQSFKDQHPDIHWKRLEVIQKLSDSYEIEAHRDTIWSIAIHELPHLKSAVDQELAKHDKANRSDQNITSVTRGKNTAAALQKLLQANRENILRIAAKHGASNVRVFGSVARGEADSESDIDLLVDMKPDRTLRDLAELLADLQALLGPKLDVVTEQGLNKRIREKVLREAVNL